MLRFTLFLMLACSLHAKERFNYSLLAFGMQQTHYKQVFETPSSTYTISSEVASPYYTTGSLSRINNTFDFEIIAASTLFSNSTTETIKSNQGKQKHNMDMTLTDIEFNLHVKDTTELVRQVLGLRYTYEVQKRYNFSQESLQDIGVLENRIATLSLEYGYLITNTNQTAKEPYHYRIGTHVGFPFYAINADTYPPESFAHGTSYGYAFRLQSYFGWKVYESVELGLYGNYLYKISFDKVKYQDAAGNLIKSTNTQLHRLNYGFMANWSF